MITNDEGNLDQNEISAPANGFTDIGIQPLIYLHQEIDAGYSQQISQYKPGPPGIAMQGAPFIKQSRAYLKKKEDNNVDIQHFYFDQPPDNPAPSF